MGLFITGSSTSLRKLTICPADRECPQGRAVEDGNVHPRCPDVIAASRAIFRYVSLQGSGRGYLLLRASNDMNNPSKLASPYLWEGHPCWSTCGRNACPHLPTLSEGAGIVSTARIEGPPLYRGASASTETSQLPCLPPSQGARSGSTGPTWVPFLFFIVRVDGPRDLLAFPPLTRLPHSHRFSQEGGLFGLPLRATFSPAHPLARRDVPLARARGVRDRALREQLGRTENMSV